uniref:Uncharacterized protein n=1 Tax=Eutreptiella gymnastica TaxID=73025 RepID=A0A7S1N417_9EUGL
MADEAPAAPAAEETPAEAPAAEGAPKVEVEIPAEHLPKSETACVIVRNGAPCNCEVLDKMDATNTCTECKHGRRWHGNGWKNSEGVYKSRNAELRQACKDNKADVVKEIIGEGAYLDCRDSNGLTMLMDSCSLGNKDVVIALLEGKADATLKDSEGNPAIFMAQEAGHADLVQAMLGMGVNF